MLCCIGLLTGEAADHEKHGHLQRSLAKPMTATHTATAQIRFRCWGKLRRVDGQVLDLHPLLDHLIDVACCFAALASCPAVRRALETTADRPLDDVDVQRLTVLALLHDIGKASAGFQVKFWEVGAPRGWPLPGGHGSEALQLLAAGSPNQGAPYRARLGLPLAEMDAWGEVTLGLLVASISHHGRPLAPGCASEAIWLPVGTGPTAYDPARTLKDIGELSRRLYPAAFAPGGAPLPDAPAFSHLFAGLVQLADWLGSDTREGFFPYSAPGDDRAATAPARAEHAVRAIGLWPVEWQAHLQSQGLDFAQAFGVPQARQMQSATGDLALGPLLILEAETGSGKTEAALWRFLQLFRAGAVDSLYFALPTRVAASQLYERVRACVMRVWPSDAPLVLRALPGYEAADGQTLQKLAGFEVLWSDEARDANAERRWAGESPKRYLVATLAIGTIDQALLAALPLKHAHLRHALLARSLLVVDEVHASDAYMTALLERALQAHLDCGGQALLLSATLGSKARQRYLRLGTQRRPPKPLSLPDAIQLPYPALSHNGSGPALQGVAGNPQTKTVHWALCDAIDSQERIAALAVDAAAQGARVLVIRNTVPAAVATLRAVEAAVHGGPGEALLLRVGSNQVSTLHHSRYSKQDRPLLDRAVEAQIGKQRSTPGGRIVVGTQTLEQSLDLDADLLITDLCPMDVLLQRVGRLHRHQRPSAERPPGFEQATAWVLVSAAGDLSPLLQRSRHGLGPMRINGAVEGIYPDLRILEATRRLVAAAPSRHIPADNRFLVESATHAEALTALCDELGEAWVALGQELDGSQAAKATVARVQAIDFAKQFGEEMFPDADEKIATRLGTADRLVLLAGCPMGPFGQAVEALTLRHHQLPRRLAPDAQATYIEPLPDAAGFDFELGDSCYRYDRFGLAKLPNHPAAGGSAA
jgi:CRISPR-associated endonuclease/helicase Cas3